MVNRVSNRQHCSTNVFHQYTLLVEKKRAALDYSAADQAFPKLVVSRPAEVGLRR